MNLIRPTMFGVAVLLAASASASPTVFRAFLDGPSEEPPNGSPGFGVAYVTIDPEAMTMRVNVSFQDLLSPTTASHIHVINGPGDGNTGDTVGPVATQVPFFVGFPIGVTSGFYDQAFDMTLASSFRAGWITDSGGTVDLARAALFDAMFDGRAYFNIHTSQFPGGEIRGFFAAVPGPGAALMFAAPALAALRRRRNAS